MTTEEQRGRNLAPAEERLLRDFLNAPERPAETLDFESLHGFLFAVLCAPELIQPSEWIPAIFGGEAPGYSDEQEAQAVIGALMQLYNAINRTIVEEEPALPSWCEIRSNALDNFAHDAPLGKWAVGFVAGHNWLREIWDSFGEDQTLEEHIGFAFMTLSFFANRALAESILNEDENGAAFVASCNAIRHSARLSFIGPAHGADPDSR